MMRSRWGRLASALLLLACPTGLDGQLNDVRVGIVAVGDSTGHLFYEYFVENASTSLWALTGFTLDIGVSNGRPDNLESTGPLRDYSTSDERQAPHAQIGVMTPDGWTAILAVDATLRWTLPPGPRQSFDSIGPGQSADGFALRSPFLPGVTAVKVLPTAESCCSEPSDTIEGALYFSTPERFALTVVTIAPRFFPEEVTPQLVRDQLEAVCGALSWIDDPLLCREFTALVDRAVTTRSDAPDALDHLSNRLEEERSALTEEGRWLLQLNVRQARRNLSDDLSRPRLNSGR